VSSGPEIEAAIAAEQAKLVRLDREREAASRRLIDLRSASGSANPGDGPDPDPAWSPQRKLALFASLFRGRPDVFPLRWENPRKGRSGWAPRCANEWKQGVCEKPRVKCAVCPNQAFVPPAEDELRAHLQGRQVMGVYPLLHDDMCSLLAIDLDGRSWREDVVSLRESCRDLNVVPAVERSRSGEGAHIWFFFDAPVPAALARRFGLNVLTDAMARSPTLGMASYDRLFPSQDTLPKGGFGNLIALPLQRAARQHGNTVFVDERFEPYDDQWSYLESLPRIAPERLEALVAESGRDGLASADEFEFAVAEAPWRPAPTLTTRLAASALPETVTATLVQRLYVSSDGLPPALIDALRRLATFSNPQFLERQRMRLSTALTPRVIACFEEIDGFIALPRGCREPVEELLDGLGVRLEITDERTEGRPLPVDFKGKLTDAQAESVSAMLADDLGVLCGAPGVGKTVIAAQLIAARGRSTLVIVHRKPLLEQWIERLCEFLGVGPEAIGTLGAGRRKPNGLLDVATVQSLVRDENLDELLACYGHVVVDECHHVPAVMCERVLHSAPARYVTGLTATPHRRDGHHPIVGMQCGSVRHTIDAETRLGTNALELQVVRRDTAFDPSTLPTDAGIQEIYGALAEDGERSEMITGDTCELVSQGRSPLVLTERREHLDRLVALLSPRVPNLVVLHGELRPAARRAAADQLASSADGEGGQVVLATGRYVGEGFDYPRLDALLLAMPIAWKGTVVQYAGRLHRAHAGKSRAVVYDYVDAEVPVLRRMFAKRLRAYRTLGYELAESP
jgi:superfamily II DNA or RNA helicase